MAKKTIKDYFDSITDLIDFNFYYLILLKYKKSLLLLPLLIAGFAFLITINLEPVYESSATLVIESKQRSLVKNIEDVYTPENPFNRINNQIEILKSDEVLEYIVDDASTAITFNHLFKQNKKNNIIQYFENFFLKKKKTTKISKKEFLKRYIKNNFRVKNIPRSDVILLNFKSNNPEIAKLALTKIIDAYLMYDVDSKVKITSYASEKINSRLSDLMISMENAEQKLAGYKKENKLTDIGDIKKLKIDEIKSISEKLLEINNEIQVKDNDMISINIAKGSIDELLAIKNLRRKKEVETIRTNIRSNENAVQSLRIIYTDDHPKVKKSLELNDSLEDQLTKLLQENIQELAYELSNLKNLKQSNLDSLATSKEELQYLEEMESGMLKFVREVDLNTKLYESFLERMKETSEAQKLQTSNVKMIQTPILPIEPIFPNVPLLVFLTYIFGIISVYSLLCYFELNRSVIQEPTVLEALQIPVISILPLVKELKKGFHLFQIFVEDSKSHFSESIRTLRTIITSKIKKNKTILISSSFPGEGKTTIAFNLALSLSKLGKVMFIETDIRRPSVLSSLEMEDDVDKKIGFSDIVNGETNLKECTFGLPGTELEILSSGKQRTDFTDMTNEEKLKQFFKLLSHHYDYIIVDTPPIQPVSDTLLLAQCVDHVYLIARSQYSKMQGVRATIKKLESLNVNLDGIILNSMDTSKSNYYGYNYYYGGYYNKGYSYSTEKA